MNSDIHNNIILGFIAVAVLMAMFIAHSMAAKSRHKWIAPITLAIVLLSAWVGWFFIIRAIAERFK